MTKKFVHLMALFILSFVLIISIAYPVSSSAVTENSWQSKSPMHTARSDIGVATVNGKIYAIGGNTATGVTNVVEEYNPNTNTWTTRSPMPTPRAFFASAVYENKIYCIGGQTADDQITAVNEVYDPATDTWTNKTSMPIAKILPPGNVINDKIYLIGGLPNGTINQVYDPKTDTWANKAPIPTAAAVCSAVFDNKIVFIGGSFDDSYPSTIVQAYDPNTNTWKVNSSAPQTFFLSASAGATSGILAPKRIYIFDVPYADIAADPNDPLYTDQIYDPETNQWSSGVGLPTVRQGFGVACLNDQFYVIGGYSVAYNSFPDDWIKGPSVTMYDTVEVYTPFGYDTILPAITIDIPNNAKFSSNAVPLNFTVNGAVDWVSYSLDGKDNITITGNITLSGLPQGTHNLTLYAKDSFGNIGASKTINFSIVAADNSPMTIAVVVTCLTVAVLAVILLARRYWQRKVTT